MSAPAEGPEVDSRLSLRAVIDMLARAVIVTDADGRIVLWNDTASELYGWSEPEVLGRTTVEVLSPIEPPDGENWEAFQRALAGESFVGDRTVFNRSGQPLRVFMVTKSIRDPDGELRWIVSASEDVSELRLAEQQHQDLADNLQLALDSARLGTWRWDIESGEVVWDERMEQLFGFERGGFDGTFEAYRAALHPADRDQVLATVNRALATTSSYRVEHRVVLADGSVRWIHGAGQPTLDADGNVSGAIGCSMDVTDRVEARLASEASADLARAAADRERIDRERFEFLTAIHEALAGAATREEIMVSVTRAAVPRLGDWCSIYVLPIDGGRVPDVETYHRDPELVDYARALTEKYPFEPDAATGIGAVIRTGQPEFYPEITASVVDDALAQAGYEGDDAEELRGVIDRLSLRSAISVPLIKHGRILGALSFVNTTGRRAFNEVDFELAQVVAGRVASSIENRRLIDEQRRIASTLQASLLPARLPDVPGLDIAVRYWAAGDATEVGGDFYDVFPVDDRRWAVVIGDVCGTGPDAAAVTALARHTIRQSAWRGDKPIELLSWLNRAVRASTEDGIIFLTVAFLALDERDDGFSATITNAGHPPAVLVRVSGDATAIGHPGGLVGPFEDVKADPFEFTMAPGDTVVLYTDGLTDVPPPHALTTTEVVGLVAAACADARSADSVAGRLEAAVEQRLRLQHRRDDIALVVLRSRHPATARS
jgi:PAS domain S-box-containing protein